MGIESIDRWAYTSPVDGKADWALVRDGASGNGLWAVVLHGHGSAGDQLFTRADLEPWDGLMAALGLGLLCPNLRGNAWMCPAAVQDLRWLLNKARDAGQRPGRELP